MKRIVASIVAVSVLTLAGVLVEPSLPSGAVMAAEVSEQEVMNELTKVKKMVADLEAKMKSKKMMMDAMGRDKTMKMLKEVTRTLEEMQRP
jgi:hypothetical protein